MDDLTPNPELWDRASIFWAPALGRGAIVPTGMSRIMLTVTTEHLLHPVLSELFPEVVTGLTEARVPKVWPHLVAGRCRCPQKCMGCGRARRIEQNKALSHFSSQGGSGFRTWPCFL